MKKLLTVLLICLFACSIFAAEMGVSPSNSNYSYIKADAYNGIGIKSVKTKINNKVAVTKSAEYPSSFDLRNDFVKNLYPFDNASWATSAADVIGYSAAAKIGNYLDISALNMLNKNPYPLVKTDGGNIYDSMAYLHGTIGPVAEIDDPWEEPFISPKTQPERLGAVDFVQIMDDGVPGINSGEMEKIKNAIYTENHPLQVSLCFDEQYIHKKYSYYCPEAGTANFSATIVGWDDTYDRAYFNNLPNYSGAFLLKFPFGSDWAEDGYIWVSYEDASLVNIAYYDFTPVSELVYDSVLTNLTGCGITSVLNGYQKGSVYFISDSNGEIDGLRLYIAKCQIMNIEIFINGKSVGYSLDYKPDYPGYVSVMLSEYGKIPISIYKGDEIQVIVNYDPSCWSGVLEGMPIPIETEYNGYVPVFHPNTNYVSDYRNRWFDVSDEGNLGISLLTSMTDVVKTVEASPSTLKLYLNQSKEVKVTVTPEFATDKSLKWVSSDPKVAEVSSDGVVTAKGEGKAVITVSSVQNPKAKDTVKVAVKDIYVPVKKLTISGATNKVNVGEKISFDAVITPDYATCQDVIWESSDEKIATIDSEGNVYGVSAGKFMIKATSVDNPDIYCIKKLTASEISVKDISVAEYETIKEGESKQIIAKVLPENATNKNLKYKLSSTKYASVSDDGIVKALSFSNSATEAKVKLRVYSAANSKIYADCKITIVHAVKNIKVPSKITVNKGKKYTVNATVVPSTAYNTDLLWKSSNKSVATVSANGVITAKNAGKCYIYVKSADNPEIIKSIKLEVTEPVSE